jgi:hypothetical protein
LSQEPVFKLHVEADEVVGELSIDLRPGTVARDRDVRLDAILADALHEIERAHQVTLAAAPSAFATPMPGKDDAGNTRFVVRGRIEGDRLVPVREKIRRGKQERRR